MLVFSSMTDCPGAADAAGVRPTENRVGHERLNESAFFFSAVRVVPYFNAPYFDCVVRKLPEWLAAHFWFAGQVC